MMRYPPFSTSNLEVLSGLEEIRRNRLGRLGARLGSASHSWILPTLTMRMPWRRELRLVVAGHKEMILAMSLPSF